MAWDNKKSIIKAFIIAIIILCYFNKVLAFDENIFFLKKEKAINFFKNINESSRKSEEYTIYNNYIKTNDILSYLNEVDYFCWKKIDRDYLVLIPDIPDKKLIRGLGEVLHEYFMTKIEKNNNYIITKEKMIAIALKMLIVEKNPNYYENVINCCNIPDDIGKNMIDFYILEILEDKENTLRVYSCCNMNNNKYDLRNPKKCLSQNKFDDCIKKWKEMLNVNPTTKIKVRIVGFIGGKDIYQICAGDPIRIKYGNFTITSYSQFDQRIENTEISNISIDFDLSKEEDIKKISSESIYYAYKNELKIITYNSLYNEIWDYYYNNTRENFFDNTVNLFYIRTNDFEPNETNANMMSSELNNVSELIQRIVRNRSRITRVKTIGYADNEGTREGNRELSLKRAQSVREWLIKNIGDMQGKIEYLEAWGCEEKYYKEKGFNDRSVEIKIY